MRIFLHVDMCTLCMPVAVGGQKKSLDPCELHVGAGNRTRVLQEQQIFLTGEPSAPVLIFLSLKLLLFRVYGWMFR